MHLIFDFDGTLVDSFHCVVEKFIQLAPEYHFRPVDPKEMSRFKDLTAKEIFKELQIPLYKVPSIIYQIRKAMHAEIKSLMPVQNLSQVLKDLHDMDFTLGILTSNSEENVNTWLQHHQLQHLFHFIYIESSFFSKNRLLKKIIKAQNIEKNNAFYVGDETRDVEAAKQNSIYSIAVTWGYNSEKALLQSHPHFIVRKPKDLLNLLISHKRRL